MTVSSADDSTQPDEPTLAQASPVAGKTPARRRRRGLALGVGGGLVALLGVGYLAAHAMASDTVPRHASVNGVPIGGLGLQEAVDTLTASLGPTDSAVITVTGEPGQSASITPTDAGLGVDYAQTVRQAGAGGSWDPRVLVKVITGGGETAPVITTDPDRLQAAVEAVAPAFSRDPVDAQLGIEGAEVRHVAMVTGTRLQAEATAQAVGEAFRDAAQRPIDGPREPYRVAAELEVIEPTITDAKVDPVLEQLTLALQPVGITSSQGTSELSPARLAEVTTVTVADGAVSMAVDTARLYEVATEAIDPHTVTRPRNATVVMEGGRPVVVGAAAGQTISPEAFAAGVRSVLAKQAPREVSLEITEVAATFTTAQAEALGIKEVVGEFTTYFPASSYHNTNLGLAAAGINNELVKPGEVFSLAKATGPRNASTGYVEGGVLVGDHIEYIVGGGVSQSATTTYNAAFFAGMTDVEHHPHTQYFSQYPPGREATVYEGVLDLKFRNDTPYGVLMEAYIVPSGPDRGSITVRVWSTKHFDSVTASEPSLYNYTDGREQVSTRPGCIAQNPSRGFDVSFQRILVLNGQTTTEDYFWRYSPIDKITCQQPDPPAQEPDANAG